MGELIGMVVYDSVLFNRSGEVRRWADRVERQFTTNAILLAPVNKRANKGRGALPVGSLKASISGDVTRVGVRHLETTISVDVPYATYVIEGTGPIIVPSGNFLYVPPNPGFGTRTRSRSVKGQKANNFLTKAGRKTARTHSSLRGFNSQMFKRL